MIGVGRPGYTQGAQPTACLREYSGSRVHLPGAAAGIGVVAQVLQKMDPECSIQIERGASLKARAYGAKVPK